MKIPSPSAALTPTGTWPRTKTGVMDLAHVWYDDGYVGIDNQALASLTLPEFKIGAEAGMLVDGLAPSRTDRLMRSIALNSLNYQFWDLQEGQFVRYAFEGIVGAMGMRAAFEKAWAPGGALDEARQGRRTIDETLVVDIFGDIPEPGSRVQVLHDVLVPGKLEALAARLAQKIAVQGHIDTTMAADIADAMPVAYGDAVLKKAQLALSEVWVQDRALGEKVECDLTAFADYQIPNILRAMGVLSYAPDLANAIDAHQPLPYGGPEECAIRGASLIAVERIAQQHGVPVAAVDHYLWMRRKEAVTPFHLTVTTAY